MPRNILILGGARFHGLKLVEHFCSKGNEVYVLNRGEYKPNYDLTINHLKVDRNNTRQVKQILGDLCFDCVVDNNAYNPSQVLSILEILRNKCKHYIFTSTAAVYMILGARRRLKEDFHTDQREFYPPLVKPYSVNKLAAEEALRKNANGLCYTIIRLPNVFGEGDFVGKLVYFFNRFSDGKEILLEKEVIKFSLIYAEDVVKIYGKIAGNSKFFTKVLNTADPRIYSYHDFFSSIFGDMYSEEKIVLAPAEAIWNSGYRFPFPWAPPLDTSLLYELIGNIPNVSLSGWGERTLGWEREHLAEKISTSEFTQNRNLELDIIKKIKSGY